MDGLKLNLTADTDFSVKVCLSVPDMDWKLIDEAMVVARYLQSVEHFERERDVAVGLRCLHCFSDRRFLLLLAQLLLEKDVSTPGQIRSERGSSFCRVATVVQLVELVKEELCLNAANQVILAAKADIMLAAFSFLWFEHHVSPEPRVCSLLSNVHAYFRPRHAIVWIIGTDDLHVLAMAAVSRLRELRELGQIF